MLFRRFQSLERSSIQTYESSSRAGSRPLQHLPLLWLAIRKWGPRSVCTAEFLQFICELQCDQFNRLQDDY